jgi:hypothetical protein
MSAPSEPVETVDAVSLLGARVMHGTWSDGRTHVLIADVNPVDAIDAGIAARNGELEADR